jgi:F0F1-type ATP synthase membrane subunit b/b'
MKTYEELEREAYINGDIKLANAYAVADAAEHNGDIQDELDEANEKLSDIASIVSGY